MNKLKKLLPLFTILLFGLLIIAIAYYQTNRQKKSKVTYTPPANTENVIEPTSRSNKTSITTPTNNTQKAIPTNNQNTYLYSKTVLSNINLRSQPTIKGSLIKLIPKNQKVNIISTSNNGTNIRYYVEHLGNFGYINEIAFEEDEEVTNKQPVTVKYTKALLSNINLRSHATVKGKLIKTIPKNQKVGIISTTKNGEYTWYYVEHEGDLGYINEVAFEEDEEQTSIQYSKAVLSNINLRSQASVKGKLIKLIPKSQKVDVISTTTNGEFTWYYIQHDGDTGYINEVAFEEDNQEQDTSFRNAQGGVTDCGLGGTRLDSLGSCYCKSGFKTGSDGKCYSEDCGIGGDRLDSLGSCYCKSGFKTGSDGKCY